MTLDELLPDERPRARLRQHGPAALTDGELVALLLGSGCGRRSSLDVGRELVRDGLAELARLDWGREPAPIGVGEAKAAAIAAALEIGRRIAGAAKEFSEPIRNPEVLARVLIARYSHHTQERLGAVYLDAKNRVIREREVYVGTLNATTVSTRDVLRFALQDHAAALVLFHNHPSGDPAPSAEDLVFTQRMAEAAKIMGVDLLDHLILGANRYVSLRQRGLTSGGGSWTSS